ncbi:hypothetical protein K461DRAFT_43524 [Myriangium duriaei CBS 260.36]|uniref:Uncharacterized protein n=1 Tax=Myriangium duriaei CBS 260.36 TaxID=1168546 RepID=A0A9P4IWZ5_9PEZI|nr:hypothetical protein K461DRAFT_43524 [Myriangium duriaei CBS 260.36]
MLPCLERICGRKCLSGAVRQLGCGCLLPSLARPTPRAVKAAGKTRLTGGWRLLYRESMLERRTSLAIVDVFMPAASPSLGCQRVSCRKYMAPTRVAHAR